MQFNLSSYILNEALQSSELYREILSEPGGYFRFMQPKSKTLARNVERNGGRSFTDDTMTSRAGKILEQMRAIVNYVFRSGYGDFAPEYNGYNTIKDSIPEDKIEALNRRYNELFDKYMVYAKNFASKPHPKIFGMVVSYYERYDLFNITDRNFKKYTYPEIRADKKAFNEIIQSRDHTIFWFKKNGKMLAISRNGNILDYGIGVTPISKMPAKGWSTSELDGAFSGYGEGEPRIDRLSNGIVIKWKRPNNHESPMKFISDNAKILTPGSQTRNGSKLWAVGRPDQSTSNIRGIGWSLDDYAIVYTPTRGYIKGEDDVSGYSNPKQRGMAGPEEEYNTVKSLEYSNKRRHEYLTSADVGRYKWRTYPDGTPMPYSMLGDVFIYDIDPVTGKGKQVNVTPQEHRGHTYGDVYNYWFSTQNKLRYDKMSLLIGINKDLPKCERAMQDFVAGPMKDILGTADKIRNSVDESSLTLELRKTMLIVQKQINECLTILMHMKLSLQAAAGYAKKAAEAGDQYEKKGIADKAKYEIGKANEGMNKLSELSPTLAHRLADLKETIIEKG